MRPVLPDWEYMTDPVSGLEIGSSPQARWGYAVHTENGEKLYDPASCFEIIRGKEKEIKAALKSLRISYLNQNGSVRAAIILAGNQITVEGDIDYLPESIGGGGLGKIYQS